MGLEAYQHKRHFDRTPEPRGAVARRRGRARFFCVQKHAASRLHYDFRLELEGVLKSWAVPKGPSLDPEVHRLAMETEDHPLEYGEFEGIIPEGEYGGGTVLLWDRGTWVPRDDDPHRAYRAGKLRFELRGEKLRGGFLLERDRGRGWRLTKLDDDEATDDDLTEDRPESVATGRDLDAIERQAERIWRSNRNGNPGGEERGHPRRKSKLPETLAIAEPKRVPSVPHGKSWVHEIAIDGAHVLGRIDGGVPSLELHRRDVTRDFPAVLRAMRGLGVDEGALDLYVADLREDGTTAKPTARANAFACDLLHLEGDDLRKRPFSERNHALEDLIESAQRRDTALRVVRRFDEDIYARACALGAPAVISRKREARYGAGVTRTVCTEQRKKDRLLWAEDGIAKSTLAEYYRAIAEHVVPHVRGRPLTLVRAPKTIEEGTVFMRHSKVWGPSALRRVKIKEKTKVGEYLVADDLDGILALVHMGVVEIHTWNSVVPKVDLSDRIVLDLDPHESVSWARVVEVARMLRDRLRAIGLSSFVKTTGGKGLHVVVPIKKARWDRCLAFARAICEDLAHADPKRFTTNMALARRPGKIFLDYLRNNRTNTSIAAFSPRARPHAPVSMPVSWTELARVDPASFTLATVPRLLARRKKDPWADYEDVREDLPDLARISRQARSATATSSSGSSPARRSPRS